MEQQSGARDEVDRIVEHAEGMRPAARRLFIREACSTDQRMREEVESLLAQEVDWLDRPLVVSPPLSSPDSSQGNDTSQDETRLHGLEGSGSGASRASGVTLRAKSIGPYRILERIDIGGMGEVYRAQRADSEFQHPVALKVMRRSEDSEEVERRFLYERRILQRLNHPDISRILDGGTTDDGLPYFVMEYIEGQSIDTYCDAHQLTIEERIRLFIKVCEAVQFAHDRQVVHRDIKPVNILVGNGGHPTLLDFGIAKVLDPDPDAFKTFDSRPMTPRYASPEQYSAEAITPASDVYSLGVVLYELLTGYFPLELADSAVRTYRRATLEQAPRRPSEVVGVTETDLAWDGKRHLDPEYVAARRSLVPRQLRRALEGDLDHILFKALAKEPARRYRSVELLAEDLSRHLEGGLVTARRGEKFYQAYKFLRRNALPVFMVVTSILAALGMVAWSLVNKLDHALREQEKVYRVSHYLISQFHAPSMSPEGDETVTARKLLDITAKAIEINHYNLPDDLMGLMGALAEAYLGLGAYDEAERWLLESFKAWQERGIAPDSEQVIATLNMALLEQAKGNDSEAEIWWRRASELIYGEAVSDVRLTVFLNNRAGFLSERGDLVAAERLYRMSVQVKEKLYGKRDVKLAVGYYNLAVMQQLLGLKQARASYEAAMDLCQTVDCEGPVNLPLLRLGLSQMLQDSRDRGDLETAVAYAREALEMLWAASSNDSEVARAQVTLGVGLRLLGEHAAAESILLRSLDSFRRDGTEDGAGFAITTMHLATARLAAGRGQEAEPTARQAVELLGELLPADHWRLAEAKSVLGGCLLQLGRLHEAEPLLRSTYPTLEEVRGLDARATREAKERLEALYEPTSLLPENEG